MLHLPRVIDALARACASDRGAALALKLRPAATVAAANERFDRADEARDLRRLALEVGLPVRLDVDLLLNHAERGGVLDGLELAAVAGVARATVRTRQAARAWPEGLLRAQALAMADLGLLASLLTDAVDDEGRLLDTASPELARLRAEVLTLAARLRKRIADLVKEEGEILQDDYWTLRDDRYVLPVKSSDKRALGGIIHGSSQTGATVYVEPPEMVAGNNQLALAWEAVRREERRILQELSGWCAEQADDLQRAADDLAALDLAMATAQLADRLQAHRPRFGDRWQLRQCRHPVLVLDDAPVVANDVAVAAPARWLVISGPNGGGKTVLLTALGLAAEMARLGLPICASEHSELPWFDDVAVVLGDAQDLDRGLSTFEGHLRAVQAALQTAAHGRVLVLLDELAGGTEPLAGSALATAVLEAASRSPHTMGAVTTHFEACKLLALRDPAFANVALELDVHTLQPTYRVRPGEAGSSNPLALAERVGIAPGIVDRARQLVGGGGSEVAQALARLATERELVQAKLAELEHQQVQLDRARALLDDQRRTEKIAADRRIERAASEALAELADVQRELADARRALRQGDRQQVSEAARVLSERQVKVERLREAAAGREPERAGVDAVAVDQQVWHPGLGRLMRVVAFEPKQQRVRVRAGVLDQWVPLGDLRQPRPTDPGYERPKSPPPAAVTPAPQAAEATDDSLALRTPERSVDLRGQRVEDALVAADRLLDRGVVGNFPGICLIHGMGTGAVRDAIRQWLRKHPHVQRFRPGVTGEGGDGVTLVWLKQ
jgi:DNA mismatch repair protein MutS2